MITITPEAARKILESRAGENVGENVGDNAGNVKGNAPGPALRLAAKRLPDGSFDYAMGWDEPGQHDNRTQSNGVPVIVAPTSVEFVRGATLDYVELEQGEHRFIFINPNDPACVPPAKER